MAAGFDPDRTQYLYERLAPVRPTRVVDIGANPIHEPPYGGLRRLGLCKVWSFEPHPVAHRKLVEAAGPNEHVLPYAVGADGAGELRICESSGFTSLLEPNIATFDALGRFHEGAKVTAREAIETRSLDSIDEVPDFDLLKIDVQGGELAVFEGGAVKLAPAVAVITEAAFTPIYVDQPLIDAQMAFLRGLGFDFHRFSEMHSFSFRRPIAERMHRRKFRSQVVDTDVVFVRALLQLATLETEQLKHLAILADGVFNSQDLAVAAQAELVARDVLGEEDVQGYLDRLPFTEARQQEMQT